LAKWFEEEHQVPINTTIKKWNELTGMNIPLVVIHLKVVVVEKKVEIYPNNAPPNLEEKQSFVDYTTKRV
jgi:hypothetical protein